MVPTESLRQQLAARAYARTAAYDAAISAWFAQALGQDFPQRLTPDDAALANLALLWWLAHAFESPLRSFTDWTNRYQLWIVLISVALVLAANVRNFRGGR